MVHRTPLPLSANSGKGRLGLRLSMERSPGVEGAGGGLGAFGGDTIINVGGWPPSDGEN